MASFGSVPPKGGRKLAYSHLVQRAPQKCHFESYNGSDHDAMQKRRLASRVFGFTRHHKPYTNLSLTQPPRDCDAYASDDERLNTNVDGHLKELQRRERAKEAEIVGRLGADREYQRQKVCNKREEEWQKDIERVQYLKELPHARVRANTSGCDYDMFTLEYKNSFGGAQLKYEDDCQKWRQALRKQHLTSKASSCKNFNILNWQRIEPFGDPLPRPCPPQPPEPSPPRRVGVCPLKPPGKPVASKEAPPACLQAGVDKLEYTEEYHHCAEAEPKIREVIVNDVLPWEHCGLQAH